MPYSDNLYSMDDESSDGENLASELSPSDGYFPASSSNGLSRVPNVVVPDPTLEASSRADAESKARQVAEENPAQRGPDSQHTQSSSSRQLGQTTTASPGPPPRQLPLITRPQSSDSQPAHGPLYGHPRPPSVYSDAPPAYSPSPSVPRHTPPERDDRLHLSRNYNTFGVSGNMGTPGYESERLLGPHPESMGAPPAEGRDMTGWVRRVRERVPGRFGWKYALLIIAVLVAFILLLTSLSPSRGGDGDGDDNMRRPGMPVGKDPNPQAPGPGTESPFQPTVCKGELHRYNTQYLPLDLSTSQNLTFKETVQEHGGSLPVHVAGQVNIRRVAEGGIPRVVLEAVTNEPDLRLFTTFDADLQLVEVSVPNKYNRGQQPCIEIKGTIWIPPDAEMGALSVRVIHLDILVFDDISLHVAESSTLSSVVGDVLAGVSRHDEHRRPVRIPEDPGLFDSRIIQVSTTSGNIGGVWPLYDMLSLQSKSGRIKVSITPQAELETAPKPAELYMRTISGSISATQPVNNAAQFPLRDYLVDIKSTSGNVHATLAFSSEATIRTTSSAITLELLPILDTDKSTPEKSAELETITTSGALAIQILEPIFFSGNSKTLSSTQTLDNLESTHKSTSGNINLRYPQSWEGTLYASTTSGKLSAEGKDLKIVRFTEGWPGSKLEARKGSSAGKKSTITAQPLLGRMDAVIGDKV
ncbi:hypothetical protein GGS20DRAFT_363351 [Poronia punctata]|nr:hypothetical protein GGS20DRAFT_363351 [Poronia punctata]